MREREENKNKGVEFLLKKKKSVWKIRESGSFMPKLSFQWDKGERKKDIFQELYFLFILTWDSIKYMNNDIIVNQHFFLIIIIFFTT